MDACSSPVPPPIICGHNYLVDAGSHTYPSSVIRWTQLFGGWLRYSCSASNHLVDTVIWWTPVVILTNHLMATAKLWTPVVILTNHMVDTVKLWTPVVIFTYHVVDTAKLWTPAVTDHTPAMWWTCADLVMLSQSQAGSAGSVSAS